MSKHHQASRRRAYGRRQHELRERTERRHHDLDLESGREAEPLERDGFSFFDFDLSTRRLRFAVGD